MKFRLSQRCFLIVTSRPSTQHNESRLSKKKKKHNESHLSKTNRNRIDCPQGKVVGEAFKGDVDAEKLESYLDRYFVDTVTEIGNVAEANAFQARFAPPYVVALMDEGADTKQERRTP